MPQLDANTFGYQYFGIIIVLISVYTILSYLVLPILLRATLVRSNFLMGSISLKNEYSSPISNLTHNTALLLKRPFTTIVLVSGYFNAVTSLLSLLINLFRKVVTSPSTLGNPLNLHIEPTFAQFINFSNTYLILFLLNDESDDNEYNE